MIYFFIFFTLKIQVYPAILITLIQEISLFYNQIIEAMIKLLKPLRDYIRVKTLGKGAYGTVYQVQEDEQNQKPYALKIISKRRMSKQPYLFDYLEGEIDFMKKMKHSEHLIKLERSQEDEQNYYILLQFCEGGDLFNHQLKQKDQVFTLEQALPILAQVIQGLQQIHQEGFLHRDIKLQNVLVQQKNGKNVYKLADFGFTKRQTQIGGTILGTQQYMSPEVYGQDYGFEVDMWAFGVLFYYMLNAQFPFKQSHPNLSQLVKKQKLQQQIVQKNSKTKKFSYKAKVQRSKKKLIKDNCRPDIQLLFQKIFQLDRQKRIDFYTIRLDPVFSKYFPQNNQKTSVIYKKGFQSTTRIPRQLDPNRFNSVIKNIGKSRVNQQVFTSISKIKDPEYLLLMKKKEQIQFLILNETIFRHSNLILLETKISISCHLLKYIIILIKRATQQIHSQSFWSRLKNKNIKLQSVLKNRTFQIFQTEINLLKFRSQLLYEQQLQNCKQIKDQLLKQNSRLFLAKTDKQSDDAFFSSYKRCFGLAFKETLKSYQQNEQDQQSYQYILVLLALTSYFDNVVTNQQKMVRIFPNFFEKMKRNPKSLNQMGSQELKVQYFNSMYLQDLRAWIIKQDQQNPDVCGQIVKDIFLGYS